MDSVGSIDRYQAFFASREAAAARIRPATPAAAPPSSGKILTQAPRLSDPVRTDRSPLAPPKGRYLDLIA